MKLTKKERLNLVNQFLILEKLYPDDSSHYANHREALESGYEAHYKWIYGGLYEGLTKNECNEVLDILDMYSGINASYRKIEDKSGIEERKIRFRGFDGNYETTQMAYVKYFMHDLNRYNELHAEGDYPDYNTHTEMLGKYQSMLAILNTYEDKYNMSKEEIIKLLEA